MLLSLFHKNYFAQISWIIAFAILFAIPDFFYEQGNHWSNHTLFLRISCLHPWLNINWVYQSVQLLFLLGIVFLLKYILTSHQLIHHSNFLPGLLIISLIGFNQLFDFQILISINLFLLTLSYSYLLKSFDDDKPDNSIFSAALFIGLSSFISYTNIVFLLLIWMSLIVFQNYSWRYIPISIAAIVVPYLFFATYLFWTDQLVMLETELVAIKQFSYQLPQLKDLFNILIYTFLGFLILMSLSKIIPETSSKIIAIRKKVGLSLWFLLISILVFIFSGEAVVKSAFLIPLSGLLGYYLRSVRNRRRLLDFSFSLFIFILLFHKYYEVYAQQILH